MGRFFAIVFFFALLASAAYVGYHSVPAVRNLVRTLPVPALNSQPTPTVTPIPVESPADTTAINSYLVSTLGLSSHSGGKVVCAHRLLDPTTSSGRTLYIWAICQEYYQSPDGSVTPGTGISVPVSLVVSGNLDSLQVVSHRTPRAGDFYPLDIDSIFPPDLVAAKIRHPDPNLLSGIQNDINLMAAKLF
jgi:hypothetical protein